MLNRKKAVLVTAVALFAGAFSMGVIKTPVTAYAKSYSTTKTIQADLNGDKKKERITFTPSQKEYDMYKKLTISINGKTVKTLKDKYFYFYNYEYKVLKLGKSKAFLYLHTIMENDDGPCYLYQYKSGKLTRLIDFRKNVRGCRWVTSLKTKGNQLFATLEDSDAPGLGAVFFKASYTYKNGKFHKDSNIHKITAYYNYNTTKSGVLTLTTTREFRLYSDTMCGKYITTVPAGTKLKVTKTYRKGIYVNMYVTGSGYSGWYCGDEFEPDFNSDSLYYFEGVSGVA